MASSAFITPLRFEDDGGFPFILTDPLVYETLLIAGGPLIVPAGFRTDLASIPRVLWNILPPVGRYDAAAVLHDYLYHTGGDARIGDVTRFHADCVLKEAMFTLGCASWQQAIIFSGVRIGGWTTWNRYRKADGQKAQL